MQYRLKSNQEPFQCCGGPFEGRSFLSGQIYAEVPPEEAERFEEVKSENSGPQPEAQVSGRRAQNANKKGPAPDAPKEE